MERPTLPLSPTKEQRRRYPRYPVRSGQWTPCRANSPVGELCRSTRPVLNISAGGACLRSPHQCLVEERFPVRMDLRSLNLGMVEVSVRVVWVRGDGEGGYLVGAEFEDSDKGFLAPAEDVPLTLEGDV